MTHPFAAEFVDNGDPDGIRLAIERNTECILYSEADFTARDLSRTQRARVVIGDREYWLRQDATETGSHSVPDIWVDDAGNRFVPIAAGFETVTISGGQAAFDLADNDAFVVTVNADCELQLPAGGLVKDTFLIWLQISGNGHTITFASGFLGEDPVVLNTDGTQTILSGAKLSSTTGVINALKYIP